MEELLEGMTTGTLCGKSDILIITVIIYGVDIMDLIFILFRQRFNF